MKVLDEIRLLICGLLFSLIILIVPKDHPESILITKAVEQWAETSIDWTTKQEVDK